MSNQIVITSGAKLRDLDDVIVATDGILSSLAFNVANGVPRLDENGKILVSQLPNSVMEFKGVWNAATNTPTLANGTGNAGDVWLCNVAGTVNFGAGPIAFAVGDYAVYTGTVWARSSGATGTVTSVGVSRDGNALAITGSPVTTSGVINLGFSGDNTQYINGAGNLTTFPSLTGFVPYTGATTNVNLGIYDLTSRLIKIDGSSSGGSLNIKQNATTILSGIGYNSISAKSDTSLQVYYGNATTSTFRSILLNVNNLIDGSTRAFEFPDANGTLALTSDISYPVTSVFGRTGAVVAVSGDYNTDQVTEGTTNLYFTNARARTAISLTTTGSSGASTYNNSTGVLNIPNYGSALSGYVPYTGATQDVDLDTHVLNAQALHVKGTAGAGHLGLKHQSASPTGSANESLIFADVNGDLGWLNGNLYLNKFITSANTANRSYTFPNASGTIALTSDLTGGTVTSVGLSAPTGFSVSGSPVTTSGTLALSFASGYSLPTNIKQSNWDDAYTWVAAFPTQTGNTGKFLTTDGSSLSWAANPLGTVTSVAMTVPTGLSIAGSPITSSGTLAVTFTAGYSIPTNASQTTWDTAYTNRITSLTVTGSSGASTLISNVLNIPTYTLSGLGGVPTSRTLTINGVTYDLSADRTWTITAGISSVSGTAPISVSTVSGAATVSISQATTSTNGYLSSSDWNTFNGKQNALTNPVTGTGTTNTLPKFTGSSTIGNSLFTDNGTNGAFGGTNYSAGTGVRSFNITAPEYAGIAFYIVTDYAADIFSYKSTGNLILSSDPLNILSSSNVILAADGVTIGSFNTTNVTLTRALSGTSATFTSNITASGIGKFWDGTQGLTIGAYPSGAGYGSIYITTVTPTSSNYTLAASSSETVISVPTGGSLSFCIEASAKIRVNSNGYVKIGAAAATANERLDVDGAVQVRSDSQGYNTTLSTGMLDFYAGYTRLLSFGTSSNFGGFEFYAAKQNNVSGYTALRMFSSGNLSIANTTDSGYKLDVSGTGRFTGSVFGDSGFRTNSSSGYVLKNDANNANLGGLVRRSYWSGGAALDTQIFAETGYGIYLNVGGSSSTGLIISSSGASTFTNLSGTGARIVGTDSNGLLSAITVGSGLSLSGGTLTATGGSAGTITGSGANGQIAYFTSASNITSSSTFLWDNTNGKLGIGFQGGAKLFIGAAANNTSADISTIAQLQAPRTTTSYPLTLSVAGSAVTGDQIRMTFNYGNPWSSTAFVASYVVNASSAATGLTFGTYNGGLSEKMYLSDVGNLLVGTSTDSGYRINVNGSINISGNFYINGSALSSGIGGSGTTSYIPRFSSSTILANSTIQDNGTYVTLTSTTYVASGQGITWKGSSGTTYDFSISNSGTVPYILSAVEIDLNAPIGMRYGLIYTFKGNGSSAYNVNILNSGVAADELTVLGGMKLSTTTCGFVVPKMSTTQKNALSGSVKVAGCIVYDTTVNLLQCWNGVSWNNLW